MGFVESEDEPAGALIVAAGQPEADWAMNLLAAPRCTVRVGEGPDGPFDAEPLDGPEHARAIRSLILRYGTSAEGLGRGPSFRLVPAPGAAGESA